MFAWMFSLVLALPFLQQDSIKTLNPEFGFHLDSLYHHSVPLVSVSALKRMEKKGAYVLDVRETDEFEVSHLKYARHVGCIWFDMRKVYDIPLDSTIVVYCAVGNRAERIGEKLIRAGYKHVYNLYGGIFEWVNEGNPVYTFDNIQTSEIHAYNKAWGVWLSRGAKVY
ncbi:Rhodanese-related sulfurtransferase [bacterium A37T11]|nr:Rhodanese-related sulfurtransferase [bacterium A37T11]